MALRAAVIGFGLAGSVFHAPLIAATPGMAVTTVVTSNRERAERARREHPGVRIESSADAVWQDPGEHDFAVIATPNDTHVPLASKAVEAGLAVVVDKPLAPTSESALELVELAERSGVLLTVFHNRRWDSDQLTLRRLLREGPLGEVHRYESRFERWRPEIRAGAWREETAPREGGGLLLDLGTHLVDQAIQLFGPPENVYGEVDRRRGGPAEDDAFVALRHASGVRSHLWVSSVAGAIGPRLRVLGGEAAFVVQELDGQEDALRGRHRPGDAADWWTEPEERWGRLVRGDVSEPMPSERGAWPRFYHELATALGEGRPPPVDPLDAVRVLDVLERVQASA